MKYIHFFWLFLWFAPAKVYSQATIQENTKTLKTYPFSDPNPVPNIGRIYPYYRFDGYTDKPIQQNWKFVELENPYIKVAITPQIGGKIWGAYEKSTQFPFVYFNNVVKFRDVAMRGAWTSGGIEINFGDIGHAPTVSNPVDYTTRTNDDGSVSCFVGAWDWASRTRWTVEVNLPQDKAYFTTKNRWFNASPLDQSYYHWMNAGFKASGNLEFIFPGSHYIGHDGDAHPWPKDTLGRNLNFYEQNNFGSYKSYHVLGRNTDFFGGYWHNDNIGFVRYAPHHEKLGQKIWVWGLSRQGMIWEKLLTDTDGQYVELQSGRLFNQAAEESINTPFKHVAFQPYASDSWKEYWYPIKNTGGITKANQIGAWHFYKTNTHLVWGFSPSTDVSGKFAIKANSVTVFDKTIALKPLQFYTDSVALPKNEKLKIYIDETLIFDEFEVNNSLRPLQTPVDFDWNSEYGLYMKGKDLANQRKFEEAEKILQKCLEKNKYNVPALGELAQLKYRQGLNEEAIRLLKIALSINTYDPLANYLLGLVSMYGLQKGGAEEAFALAALSPQFRSAALTELARLAIIEKNFTKAESIINEAIEHQSTNEHAQQLKIVVLRKTNRHAEALKLAKTILYQNPLNHLARFEENLLTHHSDLKQFITNELPHEDYIEMALWYQKAGLHEEALALLQLAPNHLMCQLWRVYIAASTSKLSIENILPILNQPPALVFPSRLEELQMLKNISNKLGAEKPWQLAYYNGVALWQVGRIAEAQNEFKTCKDSPDFVPFYLAKAKLFKEEKETVAAALTRAYTLAPDDWRVVKELATFYAKHQQASKGLSIVEKYLGQQTALPEHVGYILGQQKAQLLYDVKQYKSSVDVLKSLQILPNEGASEAHALYRKANIKYAFELLKNKRNKEALLYLNQAETWPENLGSGEPYNADNRLTKALKKYANDLNKGHLVSIKKQLNKNDVALLESFIK